ncbi:MAG: hypothetical protein HFH53_05040 [Hespellia sp.]|nr:hypothetical protein [Hespellia sp.]
MPRIVKNPGDERKIQPYDFFAGFRIDRAQAEDGAEEKIEEAEETDEAEELANHVSEEIIKEAQEKAEQLLRDAHAQAEILRKKGYQEGIAAGRQDGTREAYEEHRMVLSEETQKFKKEFSDVLRSVSVEKDRILEQYSDSLKSISLAVAEKIVQTSLQSSGDIIKRMIIAATEKITKKRWAKIYVTKCNTEVAMDVDAELIDALARLSDNVKIITMDGEEVGTCIIELPDEIIDASVSTQLENIKDILNNVRV